MGAVSAENASGEVRLALKVDEIHLWEAGFGRLYDLELTFEQDTVHSYFGLRSLELSGNKFLLNG